MTLLTPTRPRGRAANALEDLAALRAPSGGIFASRDQLFRDAEFGRDQVEVGEDLLETDPLLVRRIIISLAERQGVREDPVSEEQPGKIHHEHRSLYAHGERIGPESERLLRELSARWGGTADAMTYYGSIDATPRFVRLVCSYCTHWGPELLDQPVRTRDGGVRSVWDALHAAGAYLQGEIERSDIGLLEFKSSNPYGIPVQVWKDSRTSLLAEDGTLGSVEAPVAAIEVQGLLFDALLGLSEISALRSPRLSYAFRETADRVGAAVLKHFWLSERERFAFALTRDSDGQLQRLATSTSSQMAFLETRLFDDFEPHHRSRFVEPLVRQAFSEEFLTDAGIRCRARSLADLVPLADYHGSWAVWPKESFDIARALRKQGYPALARQLETRVLNAVNVAGAFLELFYVDPNGMVGSHYLPAERAPAELPRIPATNIPEHGQAWTVSAVLAIKRSRRRESEPPVRELERELIASCGETHVLHGQELRSAQQRAAVFAIDRSRGQLLEREFIERSGMRFR